MELGEKHMLMAALLRGTKMVEGDLKESPGPRQTPLDLGLAGAAASFSPECGEKGKSPERLLPWSLCHQASPPVTRVLQSLSRKQLHRKYVCLPGGKVEKCILLKLTYRDTIV